VNVDDVRVIDAVGGARFAQHPSAEMRLAAEVRADQLERDDALDENVAGPIDDAHAAFAEACLEAIAAGDDFAEHRIIRSRTSSSPLGDHLFHALIRS
jgi:hypothetical protein